MHFASASKPPTGDRGPSQRSERGSTRTTALLAAAVLAATLAAAPLASGGSHRERSQPPPGPGPELTEQEAEGFRESARQADRAIRRSEERAQREGHLDRPDRPRGPRSRPAERPDPPRGRAARRFWRTLLEEGRRAEREQQPERPSPAERRRPANRYADATPGEAIEALDRHHPELAAPDDPVSEALRDAVEDPDSFLVGSSDLALEGPDGDLRLLAAETPLISAAGNGEARAVDPRLRRDGDGFRVRNPLVAPTRVSGQGEVSFDGSELRLVPEISPDAAGPRLTDDRLAIPDAARDTTLILAGHPGGGVTVAWQLLSPSAPERLSFDLALPAGWQATGLSLGDEDLPAAIEVSMPVGDDGERYPIALIAPPIAVDATGEPVATEMRLRGAGAVEVTVNHEGSEEISWPLAVDPVVNVNNGVAHDCGQPNATNCPESPEDLRVRDQRACGTGANNFTETGDPRWNWHPQTGGPAGGVKIADDDELCGLVVGVNAAPPGGFGQFYFQPPGIPPADDADRQDPEIDGRSWVEWVRSRGQLFLSTGSFLYTGIWSFEDEQGNFDPDWESLHLITAPTTDFHGVAGETPFDPFSPGPRGGLRGNLAVVGMMSADAVSLGIARVTALQTIINDRKAPIDVSAEHLAGQGDQALTYDGGWVHELSGRTRMSALDEGVGIAQFGNSGHISGPGYALVEGTDAWVQRRLPACRADHLGPCPAQAQSDTTTGGWTWQHTGGLPAPQEQRFAFDTAWLGEGRQHYVVSAADSLANIRGNPPANQLSVHVDRSAPEIGFSGEIPEAVAEGRPIPAGGTLEISATDGTEKPEGDPEGWRSGISHLRARLTDSAGEVIRIEQAEVECIDPEPVGEDVLPGCRNAETIDFDLAEGALEGGTYTLHVTARDDVWQRTDDPDIKDLHEATETLEITIDEVPPVVSFAHEGLPGVEANLIANPIFEADLSGYGHGGSVQLTTYERRADPEAESGFSARILASGPGQLRFGPHETFDAEGARQLAAGAEHAFVADIELIDTQPSGIVIAPAVLYLDGTGAVHEWDVGEFNDELGPRRLGLATTAPEGAESALFMLISSWLGSGDSIELAVRRVRLIEGSGHWQAEVGNSSTATVIAEDDLSGVRKIGIAWPAGEPESEEVTRECGRAGLPDCELDDSEGFEYDPAERFPTHGPHTVRGHAVDAAGNRGTNTFEALVDRRAPRIIRSGGLAGSSGGRDLSLKVTDGTEAEVESGVELVEIRVAEDEASRPAEPTEVLYDEPCLAANCSAAIEWFLPGSFADGDWWIEVRALDAAGNERTQSWGASAVSPALPPRGDQEFLGLERFWHYEQVGAGPGATLNVNAASGNLVYHQVPTTNPGRGLASFVNLTYNSRERASLIGSLLGIDPLRILGADEATRAPYDQAGRGFSISVSGPQRVNEPLGGVVLADLKTTVLENAEAASPLDELIDRDQLNDLLSEFDFLGDIVTLRDATGTVHRFRRNYDQDGPEEMWIAPPGVDLHLEATERDPGADALRDVFWEITRPDGISYRFNGLGYQLETADRDRNTLTYRYETYDLITGETTDLLEEPGPGACMLAGLLGSVTQAGDETLGMVTDQVGEIFGLELNLPATDPAVSDLAGVLCVLRLRTVEDPAFDEEDHPDRQIHLTYTTDEPDCQTPELPALCQLQELVEEILDDAEAGLGPESTLEDLLAELIDRATDGLLGELLDHGKISKVRDHAQRELTLDYEGSRLVRIGELATAGDLPEVPGGGDLTGSEAQTPRITELTYEDPELVPRFAPRKLLGITEIAEDGQSERATTEITYRVREGDEEVFPNEIVEEITDRKGAVTAFSFSPVEQGPLGAMLGPFEVEPSGGLGDLDRSAGRGFDALFESMDGEEIQQEGEEPSSEPSLLGTSPGPAWMETVGPKGNADGGDPAEHTWRAELNHRGNPTLLRDAHGTRTEIAWSLDANVTRMVESAGAPAEAVTEYDYDEPWLDDHPTSSTGRLTELRVFADGPDADPRKTRFEYRRSGGRNEAGDGYASGAWVVDLEAIIDPRGNETTFELATDGTGNPTARTDPEGGVARATYGDGSSPTEPAGVVTSETDEVGGVTRYVHFHPAGLPEQIIGPKGNDIAGGHPVPTDHPGAGAADEHTTSARYDEVGNLIHITDPRAEISERPPATGEGGGGQDPANLPFTTTLDYDGFDRVVSERIAARTAPHLEGEPGSPFIDTARAYDRNGSVTAERDGVGEITRYRHGPTDVPVEIDSPGSDGREVACLGYDPDDLLVAQLGARAGTAGGGCPADVGALDPRQAHGTELHRDALGQVLAEVRHDPTSDTQARLTTSFAYDRRGNQVGVIDPKRNAGRTTEEAAAAARAPQQRRITRRFNAAGELTEERERPRGGEEIPPRITRHAYDDAGNPVGTEHPRSFRDRPADFDGPLRSERLYDDANRMVAEVDPLGRTTRIVRRADGSPASVTSPRGMEGEDPEADPGEFFTTSYLYDAAGDLISRSVPYAPDQYRREKGEFAGDGLSRGWKVTYERDAVGDPVRITDARGNSFRNSFLDTGQLHTTRRPSWWGLDWGAGQDNPQGGERFSGGGSQADVLVPPGGPGISERAGASANTQQAGDIPAPPEAGIEGNFAEVAREGLPDFLPKAGTTTLVWDDELRLAEVNQWEDSEDPQASFPHSIEIGKLDYDPAGRIAEKSWAMHGSDRITHRFAYDPHGNLTQSWIDELDAPRHRTSFTYDSYDRRIAEHAPGSSSRTDPEITDEEQLPISHETTGFTFDRNGNLVERNTPRGSLSFSFSYDGYDRLTQETNPAGESWSHAWDVHQNKTRETPPRGMELAGAEREAHATLYRYDPADQLTELRSPQDEGAGDRRHLTRFEYDLDGNRTRIDAPGDIGSRRVVETIYDGRGLPWIQTSGSGIASHRTSITEHDPNGNLRRIVNPKGVEGHGEDAVPESLDRYDPRYEVDPADNHREATEHATLNNHSAQDLLVWSRHPWAQSDDPLIRPISRFRRDAHGRVSHVIAPYDTDAHGEEATALLSSYRYLDVGWISAASDAREHEVGELPPNLPDEEIPFSRHARYEYDVRGLQTRWEVTGSGDAEEDGGRVQIRRYFPSGLLRMRRAHKLDPDDPEGPPLEIRRYGYAYNPNRSLTRFVDYDPRTSQTDNPWRITRVVRDEAERESAVRNRKLEVGDDEDQLDPDTLNPAPAADSEYSYDPNGNVVELLIDGKSRQAGYEGDERRTIAYSYDRLDRETEMEITGPKVDGTRTTATAYHPSGERMRRTKPNGTTETFAYTPHGELRTHRTIKPNGDEEKDQSYAYDANGNRITDERGRYEFNSRDQMVKWTRSAKFSEANPEAGDMAGTEVSYRLDAQGQIERVTDHFVPDGQDGPTVTEYDYEGERLSKTVTQNTYEGHGTATTETTFRYDALGSTILEATTVDLPGDVQPPHDPSPTPDPPTPEGCEALDQEPQGVPPDAKITRYCHDAFERLIATRGAATDDQGDPEEDHPVEEPANYSYDALDRRATKLAMTDEEELKATGYDHVGLTTRLTREAAEIGENGDSEDDERKSFDVSSSGEYLGITTADDPDATHEFKPYLLDVQGSVEGLEGDDGSVATDDSYLYSPYGNLENVTGPGEEGLSPEASDNPIRFQGFHYDSGIKTYDMHARNYRPEVARFLTEDRYQAAGADQNLVSDPLTQNRYAFLGGNPVSRVEFDGHIAWEYKHIREKDRGAAKRHLNRYYRASEGAQTATSIAETGVEVVTTAESVGLELSPELQEVERSIPEAARAEALSYVLIEAAGRCDRRTDCDEERFKDEAELSYQLFLRDTTFFAGDEDKLQGLLKFRRNLAERYWQPGGLQHEAEALLGYVRKNPAEAAAAGATVVAIGVCTAGTRGAGAERCQRAGGLAFGAVTGKNIESVVSGDKDLGEAGKQQLVDTLFAATGPAVAGRVAAGGLARIEGIEGYLARGVYYGTHGTAGFLLSVAADGR